MWSLWLYSKNEATNFTSDIENNDGFKSSKCKAKLLGNTKVEWNLQKHNNHCTIKESNYFMRPLEMSLIN